MSVSQKGFAHILLILIIFIIGVGSLGYYAYKSGQIKLNTNLAGKVTPSVGPELTSGASKNPSITVIPTSDNTAGWKTYSNTELGISFKYPNKLSQNINGLVGGTVLGEPKLIVTFADKTTVREGTDAPFDGFTLYKLTVTDPKEGEPEGFVVRETQARKNNPRYSGGTKLVTEIDKLNNVGFPVLYLESQSNIRHYLLYHGNLLLTFAVIQKNDGFFDEFEQMLSTFKFSK